jgi:hypothetical protein
MFEGQHENLHMEMEGLNAGIAQQLERASHKALLSDAKAQRELLKDPKDPKDPKPNTNFNFNFPDYRGELAEIKPKRRTATNNVTR